MLSEGSGAEALNQEVAKLRAPTTRMERQTIRERIEIIMGLEVPRSKEEEGFVQTIVDVLLKNMDEAVSSLDTANRFQDFFAVLRKAAHELDSA